MYINQLEYDNYLLKLFDKVNNSAVSNERLN